MLIIKELDRFCAFVKAGIRIWYLLRNMIKLLENLFASSLPVDSCLPTVQVQFKYIPFVFFQSVSTQKAPVHLENNKISRILDFVG
jgi:hypothetical protein